MNLIRLDANGDPFEVGREYECKGAAHRRRYIGPDLTNESRVWLCVGMSSLSNWRAADWSPVPDLLDVKVPVDVARKMLHTHSFSSTRDTDNGINQLAAILRDALDKREATDG